MGTTVRVELWSESHRAGENAIDAVMAEMHRIDRAMSLYHPFSEVSRINYMAAQVPVPLSAEMMHLLQRAQAYSELSQGAFDISFAAVGSLYDYRQRQRPTEAQAQAAHAAVGYRNVRLDLQTRSVRFTHPGTRIDLGGFAKGHAVDNAAAILRRLGIRHARISAGGDSRVIGDRRGKPWRIGIRDPRRATGQVAFLPLQDCAISTSGDYQRCFVEDGVRYHHLIDPASGRSPDKVQSVTVVGDDGLSTEAMSKVLFVTGVEEGMRLLERQSGMDAIVIDAAGCLHYSRGLQAGASRLAH